MPLTDIGASQTAHKNDDKLGGYFSMAMFGAIIIVILGVCLSVAQAFIATNQPEPIKISSVDTVSLPTQIPLVDVSKPSLMVLPDPKYKNTLIIEEGVDKPEEADNKNISAGAEVSAKKCALSDIVCKAEYKNAMEVSKTGRLIIIDLKAQKMAVFNNGKNELITPVTTGKNGFRTPAGSFSIKNKLTGVTLKAPQQFRDRGINYSLKVKYWLGLGGGYGLHDAYWRTTFGGADFSYNGSHGCINTPLEAIKKMYDLVEVGTSVTIY
jgi:lipoprotein-anchoring transpeptidase ErfK/SrfK